MSLCGPNATLEDFLWETLEFYAGKYNPNIELRHKCQDENIFFCFSVKSSDLLPNVL